VSGQLWRRSCPRWGRCRRQKGDPDTSAWILAHARRVADSGSRIALWKVCSFGQLTAIAAALAQAMSTLGLVLPRRPSVAQSTTNISPTAGGRPRRPAGATNGLQKRHHAAMTNTTGALPVQPARFGLPPLNPRCMSIALFDIQLGLAVRRPRPPSTERGSGQGAEWPSKEPMKWP